MPGAVYVKRLIKYNLAEYEFVHLPMYCTPSSIQFSSAPVGVWILSDIVSLSQSRGLSAAYLQLLQWYSHFLEVGGIEPPTITLESLSRNFHNAPLMGAYEWRFRGTGIEPAL